MDNMYTLSWIIGGYTHRVVGKYLTILYLYDMLKDYVLQDFLVIYDQNDVIITRNTLRG